MSELSRRHAWLLRAYLVGRPRENGEWDLCCPLHEDENRSASLNTLTGEWYCFAGCGGGSVKSLIDQRDEWVPPPTGGSRNGFRPRRTVQEVITEGKIKGWNAALLDDEAIGDYLFGRGIHTKTISDFEIGWDRRREVYTIPIRGPEGEIWNVRRYTPNASAATKIRSVTGMRTTELYPVSQLKADRIIFCEGEWDALVTIQHGFAAVTRTSGANVWNPRWSRMFEGKLVYVIQDRDREGSNGARKIARSLRKVADVRVIDLPYALVPKHGKDLTDYWMEHDNADFERLLASTAAPVESADPDIITVLESFDARRVAATVRLQVTVKGRKDPGYSVPRRAKLTCTQDAGAKCLICPLNDANGEATVEIPPSNPIVLEMIDNTTGAVTDMLRREYGAQKCNKLDIDVEEYQAVEMLFARPSIDHSDGTKAKDYKNIKVTSVGHHDTMANTTVVATGALYPSPREQRNEFLAWDIQQQQTSVDHFEMTTAAQELMRRFRPAPEQRPLQKVGEIERELAAHVTRITGRPEMHAIMDLTFHSLLSFKFGGQLVHRGWLETLVVGDTRTGKSETAERLVRHFGAGEIVGGEAASLAGLVGGLQQIGGRDWSVTWGVIPINDRRVVIIDELSGLQPEDIAKMSDVRASGMARLTKIQQEVTFARTRLIWMGNPRQGGMDQFAYGVDAIPPLIGNPEDIARFDLAMAVSRDDVSSEVINRPTVAGELHYTSEACHTLLMWVWTRQPDQIVWTEAAEEMIYRLAIDMGSRYVEDPPLVQAANVRIKIARLSAAIAARTFSTDAACERVIITEDHVEDAVVFMDLLYGMPSFGYAQRSSARIADVRAARHNVGMARDYLKTRPMLAMLFRTMPRLRRQDLEEIMNMDRVDANSCINSFYAWKMLRKEGADHVVEPVLQDLLRKIEGELRSIPDEG